MCSARVQTLPATCGSCLTTLPTDRQPLLPSSRLSANRLPGLLSSSCLPAPPLVRLLKFRRQDIVPIHCGCCSNWRPLHCTGGTPQENPQSSELVCRQESPQESPQVARESVDFGPVPGLLSQAGCSDSGCSKICRGWVLKQNPKPDGHLCGGWVLKHA